MDERFDLVRSVTDGRYVYIRNYMPHKIYGQHVSYMFETPTTQVWKRLHDEGKLTAEQDIFWNKKPPEELYDVTTDPDEVHNLADSPDHQQILAKLRKAQRDHAREIRDVGFLPEGEIHDRSQGASPYDMARVEGKYPFERIVETAEAASMLRAEDAPRLVDALHDHDSAVRYWGAMGLLMRGEAGATAAREELLGALRDDSPYVRIVAAEALAQFGRESDLKPALDVLAALGPTDTNGVFVSMAALNSLDALGAKAAPVAELVRRFPAEGKVPHSRYNSYVPRLLEHLGRTLGN
jgi:uncharacterized sulfatase